MTLLAFLSGVAAGVFGVFILLLIAGTLLERAERRRRIAAREASRKAQERADANRKADIEFFFPEDRN